MELSGKDYYKTKQETEHEQQDHKNNRLIANKETWQTERESPLNV